MTHEISINGKVYLLIEKETNINKKDNNYNSGHYNSGDHNSGNFNSGNNNSGHFNSGVYNSGNHNSGHYNSGNNNSGYFNSNRPLVRIFNKETNIMLEDIDFPNFLKNIILTKWINIDDLKEDELTDDIAASKGYLKTYGYKNAFRKAWDSADIEDRKKVLLLPNFDSEIFLEISGIDVAKEFRLN